MEGRGGEVGEMMQWRGGEGRGGKMMQWRGDDAVEGRGGKERLRWGEEGREKKGRRGEGKGVIGERKDGRDNNVLYPAIVAIQ